MERESSDQPNVVVRLIGWTGIVSPKVQVFIDGLPVGVLRDRRPRSLTLGAGLHQVVSTVGFMRSGTLFVSLAPGERVTLECGLRRRSLVLPLMFLAVSGAGLALIPPDQLGTAIATQCFAFAVIAADLVMAFVVHGAKLYLRRGASPSTSENMPERLAAPSPASRLEIGRLRFQFRLRGLLIVVACCTPCAGWPARPGTARPRNRPARAFRMIRSPNQSDRLSGVRDLHLLVILKSLTPEQVDAAIAGLLVALRDRSPEVRQDRCRDSSVHRV